MEKKIFDSIINEIIERNEGTKDVLLLVELSNKSNFIFLCNQMVLDDDYLHVLKVFNNQQIKELYVTYEQIVSLQVISNGE